MTFLFENGDKTVEALVTALHYESNIEPYRLDILGLDNTGYNYTQKGNAWLSNCEFNDMAECEGFEFPHEIIGKKLKLVATTDEERNIIDEKILSNF